MNATQLEVASAGALSEELDSRVEDYLQEALEKWLPDYARQSVEVQHNDYTERALTALAETLMTEHGDPWLTDVLDGPHGPNFDAGVISLSAALDANKEGDYVTARAEARKASRLFHISGNSAAELRANAEEIYALHLLYRGQACASLAERTASQLKPRKYEWLRSQVDLERSNCFDLLGDLGESKRVLDYGVARAKEHHFQGLYLRGVGFQADASAALGDTQAGFSSAYQGLALFWSSRVGLMKGYNLYTDLDTAADILRLPHLQVALWDEATSLIDLHPDLVQRR